MNNQGWFPLGLTGLILLQSKGLSSAFSSTTTLKSMITDIQEYNKSNIPDIIDQFIIFSCS